MSGFELPARPKSLAAALLALALALAGCGVIGAESAPVPGCPRGLSVSPVIPASGPRIVAERRANVIFFVSNQSDQPVKLTVTVGGAKLISGPFPVEGPHHHCVFPANASRGRYVLTAVSDTGAEMRHGFELPDTGRRYAVIYYWYSEKKDHPSFSWQFGSEGRGFA